MDVTEIVVGIAQTLAIGIFMYYLQRKQAKVDKLTEVRAAMRKRESLLQLELSSANGKLSYALAMALKRGVPNGEVEDAVDAYEKARDKYDKFIQNMAAEHMRNE